MNAERVDLLIQYALALAAEKEPFERELGPIHLLKYVYLGDLAYASRNGGATFTGADWKFFKFGPWSNAVHDRIRPAVQGLRTDERRFDFTDDEGDEGQGVRWKLASRPDPLIEEIEKQIPGLLASAMRRAVREFGADTPGLLHHVYRTRPMLHAAPLDMLDFSRAVPEPIPQFEKPQELTAKQKKKLRAAIQAAKEQRSAKAKRRYVTIETSIYDDVFAKGVESLDRDGGDELVEFKGTTIAFSDEIWRSKGRHDDGIP